MKLKSIQIQGIDFHWGLPLKEIKSALSNTPYAESQNPYSKSISLRIKTNEILGIATNSCEFTAPSEDRLINALRINLPIKEEKPADIVHQLVQHFGDFEQQTNYPNAGHGSVIQSTTWKLDNCHLGLSIFGRIRKENRESNKGMLTIILQDLELLHDLYAEELEVEMEKLNKALENGVESFKIFATKEKQSWSYKMEQHKYPDQDWKYLSTALNSFNKRAILLTPALISTALNEKQIGIFRPKGSPDFFIANKNECCKLHKEQTIYWMNTLPAKGGGHGFLKIEYFYVSDEHSQEETKRLVAELEKVMGIEIPYQETYDC